jgi:hypothetical protein
MKYSFIDDEIKLSKQKVSPQLYKPVWDWQKNSISTCIEGHTHKDEFRKEPKLTIFDSIIKKAKKDHVPAPGYYSLPETQKSKTFCCDKQP